MKTYFPNHKRPVTLIPYMLMLPTILLLCWLLVYPVFNVFYTSFWQEMLSRPKANAFIGLKNYHKILSDPVFFEALGNSFRWVIVSRTSACSGSRSLSDTEAEIPGLRHLPQYPFSSMGIIRRTCLYVMVHDVL